MTEHKCNHEEKINSMDIKIDAMAKDIKSLLKFKWQIMGGTAVVSFLAVLIITLIK